MAEKSVTQPGSVFDPSLFIDTYDPAELDELMDEKAYAEFCANENH